MAKSASPIKFGTDGWRALIARDFTFENVRSCAAGTARYLQAEGLAERGLVIGYDTRFASEDFAAAVADVAAAHGIDVALADRPAPTPVVSYNIPYRNAGAGVVITASHNPAKWNGFKFKPDYGGSAPPEVVEVLERHIADAQRDGASTEGANSRGAVTHVDLTEPYAEHLKRVIDLEAIRDAGLQVVVDSMHGAGGGFFRQLLSGGATTVEELRAEPNPAFPGMAQPEPITQNLAPSITAIRDGRGEIGLATDGDADRLGLIDERGEFVSTLQTFALLCLHQLEVRGERGPLVRSLTQSAMVDKLAARYSVDVHVTPVGFKYVGPVMMREDALAAGEESGGYAFRGNVPERDGLLSGMLILEMCVRTGKRLSELVQWLHDLVGEHAFERLDVHLAEGTRVPPLRSLADAAPKDIAGLKVERVDTTDGVWFVLEGGYWGLVRASGTEPLLRIYAEADSPNRVSRIHHDLRTLAGV